jgi:hypothetical protein
MKKRNLLLVIAVTLCSIGFSQNGKFPVKIFIGNTRCGENEEIEISRNQLLKESKLTIIVGEKDTISKMSFTMQTTQGKNLTERISANNNLFTTRMIACIQNKDENTKAKKIWVENIQIETSEGIRRLPMFTIIIK